MNFLRHLLLAAVLVFAQLAASAHAVEHLVQDEGSLPKHACELCLAAHDLGSALPTLPVALPLLGAAELLPVYDGWGLISLPAPRAVQRGPPLA